MFSVYWNMLVYIIPIIPNIVLIFLNLYYFLLFLPIIIYSLIHEFFYLLSLTNLSEIFLYDFPLQK